MSCSQPITLVLRLLLLGFATFGGAHCLAQTFEDNFGLQPRRLTLRQTVGLALAHSLDVKIDHLDIDAAQSQVAAARGKFDPVFNLSGSLQDGRIAQNAQEYVQTGGLFVQLDQPRAFRQRSMLGETSLEWRLPTGTSVVLFSQVGSFLNDLNRQSPPALFSPEQRATTGVSLIQPLLKDFGLDVNLAEMRVSRTNVRIARLEWEQKLIEVIAAVMRDYYALSYAVEAIELRRGVVAFAQTLLHENQKRLEAGVGAAAEVAEARVGIATAREDVVAAMSLAIERQRVLKTQLLTAAEDGLGILFLPVDMLPPAVGSPPGRTRCLVDALSSRPDHLRRLQDAEKQDIILKYARNQTLPRLDLKATLSASGLDGGLGGAYLNSVDRQGYNAMIGFEFSVPLGNRAARAARSVAEARKEQALLAIAQSELQVGTEVEEALAAWQAAAARLSYTRDSVAAANELLTAEQKRFEQGVARSFDVIRARRQVADARAREVAALADWNAARTSLHARTGKLLSLAGVSVVHGADDVRPAALQVPPQPSTGGSARRPKP